jgi:hypothetical protein
LEKPKKAGYVIYKLDHGIDIYDDNSGYEHQKDVSIFFIIFEIMLCFLTAWLIAVSFLSPKHWDII